MTLDPIPTPGELVAHRCIKEGYEYSQYLRHCYQYVVGHRVLEQRYKEMQLVYMLQGHW